jgi:hypothetical protein
MKVVLTVVLLGILGSSQDGLNLMTSVLSPLPLAAQATWQPLRTGDVCQHPTFPCLPVVDEERP